MKISVNKTKVRKISRNEGAINIIFIDGRKRESNKSRGESGME